MSHQLNVRSRPVASFRADGAYDTRAVYASLDEVRADQIDIAIPPRRTTPAPELELTLTDC